MDFCPIQDNWFGSASTICKHCLLLTLNGYASFPAPYVQDYDWTWLEMLNFYARLVTKKAWTRKKTLFFKAMEIRPDFNCLCKQIVFLKIGYHYKFNLTPHCSSNFACLIQFRWNIISHFPLSKFKRCSIPSMPQIFRFSYRSNSNFPTYHRTKPLVFLYGILIRCLCRSFCV